MNSSIFSASTPVDFFSINNGIYFSSHDGDVTVGSGNGFKTYLAWGTLGQSAHVINATGAIGLNTNLGTTPALSGTTNFGTSGQVLTSAGSAATPTWTTPFAGLTITDDTSTNATRYLTFTSATSGTITTANTSSTKLAFNPSTGFLGIGTASPSANIQISSATAKIRIGQDASSAYLDIYRDAPTGASVYNAAQTSFGFHVWQTASTERMRLDASGNLGIGTTTTTGAQLTVAGSSSISALKVPNIVEPTTVSATAATGTINYDVTTQSVLYYTTSASANWTVNFRGSSGTSLNTLMAVNDTIAVTFMVTQGATAYYNNALTIDGTSVTPKWAGGTAPTSGNASGIDIYNYVITKTASATYTVLASITQFK
jgi:hypothetical protein